MSARRYRSARLAVALMAVVALFSTSTQLAEAKAAKAKSPAHLHLVKNSYGKFEVAWSAASHATTYRVTVASDRSMKHVLVRLPFSRGTSRWVTPKSSPKIKEGVKYYVQVRAFNTMKHPGGKSKVLAVTTKVLPPKQPQDPQARPLSPSSLRVTWQKATYATGYTVRLSKTKTSKAVWSTRVTAKHTSLTIAGLSAAKLSSLGLTRSFFVTVRADRLKRTFRDSRTVAASLPYPIPTGSKPAATITVGSYNLLKYTMTDAAGRNWKQRVVPLASTIAKMHADIVGVQEAVWDLHPGPGVDSPVKKVAAAAGLTVAMNPADRSKPCDPHSVHLLYNAAAFTVSACGTSQLKASTDGDRFVTWAVLTTRTNNPVSVLAATTHLTVDHGGKKDSVRAAEAREVLAVLESVNARRRLPVILTGDMNSFEGRADTTPLSLYASAGLLGADLVAQTVSHIDSDTGHGFKATKPYGLRIDHILTSSAVRPQSFTVDVSNYRLAPSDHFPVQARLTIYRS